MVDGITIAAVGQGGQGNKVNGITASTAQGQKGEGNMVGGVTIAAVGQGGQGNMVNGITIAAVGQGNMVEGVTIANVGQGGKGDTVKSITASIKHVLKDQKNTARATTAYAYARGTTIPTVDASLVYGYGYEPFAKASVASDYTLGRHGSILSGLQISDPHNRLNLD